MAHANLVFGIVFTKHEFCGKEFLQFKLGDSRTAGGLARLGKALLRFEELD